MQGFIRSVHWLCRLLNWVAVGSLVVMMCLTCADIVLRLFRRPILGTWEIVGFLGALLAGFSLAQTTVQRGHVAVQVIVRKFSQRIQWIVFLVTHVFGLLLFGLLTVESAKYGHALQVSGEVSPTLQIPFFPILHGIAFCSFVVFVVLFIDFLLVITRREEAWFGWPD
ncbi:MAG: TRAP transporter small permease [Desulfatiglandales bacterium]